MAPLLIIVYLGDPVLTLGCFLIGINRKPMNFINGFAAMGVKAS